MLTAVLTTLGGALFGQAQNFIEQKQHNNQELALAKLNKEKEIELAKEGVIVSQNNLQAEREQTKQSISNQKATTKEANTEEYKAFATAATKTSALWQSESKLALFSNFIVSTTRPAVTYILLILIFLIALRLLQTQEVPQKHLQIFDLLLAEFSAVMSYWFVRRSFEKRYSTSLKKK